MYRFYLFVFCVLSFTVSTSQIIDFPDANFKTALLNHTPVIDTNLDGEIEVSEAAVVGSLLISFQNIVSLEGIENFTSLVYLNCVGNNIVTINLDFLTHLNGIDLNVNPDLVSVDLRNIETIQGTLVIQNLDNLESINFSALTEVGNKLEIRNLPNLTSLPLQNLTSVGEELILADLTQLGAIDLDNLVDVGITLDFLNNSLITNLSISNLISVGDEFEITDNPLLVTFNANALESANKVRMFNNASLTEISFPSLQATTYFLLTSNNAVTSISVPLMTTAERLFIYWNDSVESIDLHSLISVESLVSTFEIYENSNLETINLQSLEHVVDNIIFDELPALTNLDLTSLETVGNDIIITDNAMNNINLISLLSVGNLFEFSSSVPSVISAPNLISAHTIKCADSQLTNVDFQNLKTISSVRFINNNLTTINFPSLESADLLGLGNNDLQTILFGVPNATIGVIWLYGNNFSTLSLPNLQGLKGLHVSDNNLLDIDITSFDELEEFYCVNNQFTNLDLSESISLETLDCSHNFITSLEVNNSPNLRILTCEFNQMETLVIDNELLSFNGVECNNNNLTELDLSAIQAQQFFVTGFSNDLVYLNLKNGIENTTTLDISDNPNLEFICSDTFESEINNIEIVLANLGYTDVVVNSYCSFVPGGEFYEVEGEVQYDFNGDGCDINDYPASYFKFNITNSVDTGSIISDASGMFYIPVQEGIHTITPKFENPEYWNISPVNLVVDFPTDPSPTQQDFCISANGSHLDLEISLVPIFAARPGFEARYKIIYANKGNTTLSGSLSLNYNNDLENFVLANPSPDSQNSNTLFWNFAGLLPFETREIEVNFEINAPTDNPPVNIDDILTYTLIIEPVIDDETPIDNTFILNQVVVGSFDPNDKTCLQGESVGVEMIGEYIHYLIRFENTGNFPAENIVVKDIIDDQKFDISSLQPIIGSHEFVTRINNNIVEFIFEGINLPFDDANNDGYIVFKIKTDLNLILGDTFSNTAAIYFDYNFPVITNEFITVIEEQLGIEDFNFSSEFIIIYPNPSENLIHFKKKGSLLITSLELYNMLGQVLIAIPNEVSSLNISQLQSGNYFLKVNTDKGSAFTKIVKN